MSHTDTIRAAMVRAFFASAYADQAEEAGTPIRGQILDALPDPPDPEAVKAAAELCQRMEAANGAPVGAVYVLHASVLGPRDFGHYAAMGAMGHGVGLWDFGISRDTVKVPSVEFTALHLSRNYFAKPSTLPPPTEVRPMNDAQINAVSGRRFIPFYYFIVPTKAGDVVVTPTDATHVHVSAGSGSDTGYRQGSERRDVPGVTVRGVLYYVSWHLYRQSDGTWTAERYHADGSRDYSVGRMHLSRKGPPYGDGSEAACKALGVILTEAVNAWAQANADALAFAELAARNNAARTLAVEVDELKRKLAEAARALVDVSRELPPTSKLLDRIPSDAWDR